MKIPLYNKGLGATGVTTGASLGPRATSGAFTGVGQGLAEFGRVANKVATDFLMLKHNQLQMMQIQKLVYNIEKN